MLGRGDIVWINFSPQRGHEQAGRRPALVISPAAYNDIGSCVLVCPITSNTAPWPWKVMLPDSGQVQGAVLVDQIKSIDPEARDLKPSGQSIPQAMVDEVLARLATLVT